MWRCCRSCRAVRNSLRDRTGDDMGKPSLTAATADHFRERLAKLEPDSERRFGTLDPVKMMRHMRHTLEAAIGKVEVKDESIPILRHVMYIGICHVITTWPGGRIKAPDSWTPPADKNFDDERTALLAAVDDYVDVLDREPERVGVHPALGPLTVRKWSRYMGFEFHHHLRQFGV